MSRLRIVGTVVAIASATVLLGACSTEARAERNGKQFGDAVCDLRGSDNANEAQRHLRKAQNELDDLNRFVGRDVRQDLADIDRNLDQLVRDVSKGKSVREQDVNAIMRNVDEVRSTLSGSAEAAYDGVLEGLANCN